MPEAGDRREGSGRIDVREGKAMSIEQRIRELGLELPAVKAPAANYAYAVRTGNLVFLRATCR
jgi:hypothetical protein